MQTIKTVPLSKFAKFSNIRLGAYYELPELAFEYEPFMGFVELLEAGSRPSGGINESDKGQAISLGGEQIGTDGSLNINKIPYVPLDYYENATKGKIYDGDMEKVPRKLAIVRANRYMVDHVDYLIAYAWHPASNARELVEYAKKRELQNLISVTVLPRS